MRNALIFVLLFAASASAQTPQWKLAPVPHWSCPSGSTAVVHDDQEPVCITLRDTQMWMPQYDQVRFEYIEWKWFVTLPKSGELRIQFPPNFSQMPGCDIKDLLDSYREQLEFVVSVNDESKAGITLHGKPKHDIVLSCKGYLKR